MLMSEIVNYGVATVAAAATQFLLARRAEFLDSENALYNTASVITTTLAFIWFVKCKNRYYMRKIGCSPSHGEYPQRLEQISIIKNEQRAKDVSLAVLSSHALGWIAGSFASSVFKYNPHHIGSALLINGAAFGVYTLVLLGTKEIAY